VPQIAKPSLTMLHCSPGHAAASKSVHWSPKLQPMMKLDDSLIVTFRLQRPPPQGSSLPGSGQHTGVHSPPMQNRPAEHSLGAAQSCARPFRPLASTQAVV
jgi:hypothetical protein